MFASSVITQGEKEPVAVLVVDEYGNTLTGKTDIKIFVRRTSDNFYYDWTDDTFKVGASVAQLHQPLIEVSAAFSPGQYILSTVGHVDGFDTATIVNPNSDDRYVITAIQDGGADANNVPLINELRVVEQLVVEDRYPVIF
jgi:hypothetical protein